MNVDNTQDITVLSLCAGYGGLELGLSAALANPLRVIAVEIEAYALANLVTKAEEGKLAIEALWPDLRTFPAERFRGCFDFVISGYPCQPFSVAGKRQGADDPRHLWPAIARIVAAVEPLWCFFENVPGHLSLGFPDVYCSLRDMGYKVEAGLFTAAEVGAPHKRERLFILAHRESERNLPVQQQGQWSSTEPGGELANSSREPGGDQDGQVDGRLGQADVSQGHGQAGSIRAGATGELAEAQRVQGPEPAGSTLSRRPPDEQGTQWPARPGQPQYEWEEPRVVAGGQDARRRGQEQKRQEEGRITAGRASEGQAEPGVGLSIDEPADRLDRSACRVDELRLLGNGVVPQQAELAFRELMELHNK